jgi:GNAT superfamily N-acetyltransferase
MTSRPRVGAAGEISEHVRRQAMHPFSLLPTPPSWSRVSDRHTFVLLHPLPMPQIVEPQADLTPEDIDAAIEESRKHVREHGKDSLVWLTGPDHPWLQDALRERGLRNDDNSAMEAIENAMVQVASPTCPAVDGIVISRVDTFEAFAESVRVEVEAFALSAEERRETEAGLKDRWRDYTSGDYHRRWIAAVDGRVVGTAAGVFGAAGLNMFGGAVVPEARGQGVYQALVAERWEAAVRAGTPALTVQAGRMSRPILERLGFTSVAVMPTFVDDAFN